MKIITENWGFSSGMALSHKGYRFSVHWSKCSFPFSWKRIDVLNGDRHWFMHYKKLSLDLSVPGKDRDEYLVNSLGYLTGERK